MIACINSSILPKLALVVMLYLCVNPTSALFKNTKYSKLKKSESTSSSSAPSPVPNPDHPVKLEPLDTDNFQKVLEQAQFVQKALSENHEKNHGPSEGFLGFLQRLTKSLTPAKAERMARSAAENGFDQCAAEIRQWIGTGRR